MIDFDWLWVKSLKDDESGLVPKALTEVLVSMIYMTSIWGSFLILLSLFRNSQCTCTKKLGISYDFQGFFG